MNLWWPRTEDVKEWLEDNGFFSRDCGLLGSALQRPLMTIAGQEMYPTLLLKLAALLDSIQRNRPLLDGNKHLGFLLIALILRANGVDDSRASDEDWYNLILEVISKRIEIDLLAERIMTLTSPMPACPID